MVCSTAVYDTTVVVVAMGRIVQFFFHPSFHFALLFLLHWQSNFDIFFIGLLRGLVISFTAYSFSTNCSHRFCSRSVFFFLSDFFFIRRWWWWFGRNLSSLKSETTTQCKRLQKNVHYSWHCRFKFVAQVESRVAFASLFWYIKAKREWQGPKFTRKSNRSDKPYGIFSFFLRCACLSLCVFWNHSKVSGWIATNLNKNETTVWISTYTHTHTHIFVAIQI